MAVLTPWISTAIKDVNVNTEPWTTITTAVACTPMALSMRNVYLWIYLGLAFALSVNSGERTMPGVIQEYCDTEAFRPSCAEDEVVRIVNARYGRMQLGRCVEIDLGYVGCYTNVMAVADARCSGRHECEIRVPDAELESTRPCFKELKTYLEASYTCVKVATRDTDECHRLDYVNITSPQGWLSSYVSLETGCGSTEHPWVIHALPGQRINLTLYDFSIDTSYTVANEVNFGGATQACKEYALVQEWGTDQSTVVCGGTKREQHVLHSLTNSVEIKLTNNNDKYFIMRYDAVGCADQAPPPNGWFERKDSGAVVGCYHSHERWHLTCTGTTWIGHVGNCSAPAPGLETESPHYDIALPIGASVAIIIGAAVGVGLVVVVVGLIRFKRTCHQARGYETPSRETIILREKTGPPPPGVELHQVDSGHCSLDIGAGGDLQTQTTMEDGTSCPAGGGGGIGGAPHTARIGFVRHQRVVKIGGNDYAHIWEAAPLQDSGGTGNMTSTTPRHIGAVPPPAAAMSAYRTMIRAPIGSEGCTCMYHIKPAACPVPPPNVNAAQNNPVPGQQHPQTGGNTNVTPPTTVSGGNNNLQPTNDAVAAVVQNQQNTDTLKLGTTGRRTAAYQKSPTSNYEPPRYSTLERNKGLYGNSSSV